MQQEVTVLHVDWSEALGSPTSVGAPYLFAWLRAEYIQPGTITDGRVVVLVRDGSPAGWARYAGSVSESEATALICALSAIGIPGRKPRVATVYDGTDTLYSSSVRIVVATEAQAFKLDAQRSGFQGEDAEGLREALRRVLALAGYEGRPTMFA